LTGADPSPARLRLGLHQCPPRRAHGHHAQRHAPGRRHRRRDEELAAALSL